MGRGFKQVLMAGASIAALGLVAGQASAADLSGPAMAEAAPALPYVSAVMSLYAGAAHAVSTDEDFTDNVTSPTFGGDARIGGRNWLLELQASYRGDISTTGSSMGTDASLYLATVGHFLMRSNPTTYGIFGGLNASGYAETSDSNLNIIVGAEAAHARGTGQYYAQLGGNYCIHGNCTSTWEVGAFGRFGLRQFLSPNSKFEIDLVAALGLFDSTTMNLGGFGWGLEYEHQVAGSHMSFFGAYKGTRVSTSTGGSEVATDHAFLVGVRARTAGTDLQTAYVDGAGIFNIPAHHFHRFYAFPDTL